MLSEDWAKCYTSQMDIKHWPYWLKGASVFGVLFIPLLPGLFLSNEDTQWAFIPLLLIWVLLGYERVGRFSDSLVGEIQERGGFGSTVITIAIYILIGAAIGWIYGKIKKRQDIKSK